MKTDFPQMAVNQESTNWMAGDFSAQMPVQKGKTETGQALSMTC
jgi:hypothetical protein